MGNWEKQYEVLSNVLADRGIDVAAVKQQISCLFSLSHSSTPT